MPYQYHTTDVFTDTPFGGNQLAVLPDARGLSDEQMAAIAREFNFSETTFVLPPDNPAHTRRVRIFTPGSELPFAGHPTVGTAFVLAATGEIELTGAETRIVFEQGVGPVPVSIRTENGWPTFCQLTTAKIPAKGKDSYDAAAIAEVLSLVPGDLDVGGRYEIEAWSAGVPFLFVPLKSLDALGRARINLNAWVRTLRDTWASEPYPFVVTGEAAIRARLFAPAFGIPEDPATGSACAALGGYLALRSDKSEGMLSHTVHQGVEMGRPSKIEIEVDLAGAQVTAVRVGGSSVLISSGTLHVK